MVLAAGVLDVWVLRGAGMMNVWVLEGAGMMDVGLLGDVRVRNVGMLRVRMLACQAGAGRGDWLRAKRCGAGCLRSPRGPARAATGVTVGVSSVRGRGICNGMRRGSVVAVRLRRQARLMPQRAALTAPVRLSVGVAVVHLEGPAG